MAMSEKKSQQSTAPPTSTSTSKVLLSTTHFTSSFTSIKARPFRVLSTLFPPTPENDQNKTRRNRIKKNLRVEKWGFKKKERKMKYLFKRGKRFTL